MKTHRQAIKIIAVLCIFALLALKMDWASVENLARNISLSYTSIALLLIIGQLLLLAYRWKIFMNAEKNLIKYDIALNITVASQLANVLFINSVGGIVVKIALARHYGLSILKSICATIADRLMTLLAIVVYAVLFLPYFKGFVPPSVLDSLIALIGVSLVIAFLSPSLLVNFMKPLIMKNRHMTSTFIYLRKIIRRSDLAGPVLATSFAGQLFYFMAVCFAAKSIGLQFEITHLMAMLPVITLISSLPISFGGWGIREGAFVFWLNLVGIPAESAFLISVEIGFLGILSTLIMALPALFSGKLQSVIQKATAFRYEHG
ncbi:MAG TPA: lysylphosphatidylglycerol synthase transmembrane domain-containing protein [Micavibrio sp.]|nr:lysylphosphatidylglycerol synthase transmembrane domain-containing protein [Micavibrio sp.]